MSFKQFAVKQKLTDSSYNQKVSGTNRMGAGVHEGVTLASVNPVESSDYHAYDLVWENSQGETFNDRIFVTGFSRDAEGNQTQEREITSAFVKLGLALSGGDHTINQKFFLDTESGAYIDPELLKNAISCKATIVIGLPKSGLTVKNRDQKLVLVDIETNETDEDFGQFDDFSELTEKAKEEGIKLAYNRVKTYKVFRDEAEANKHKISSAIEARGVAKKTDTSKPKAVQGF
jgi:hypothetical protein